MPELNVMVVVFDKPNVAVPVPPGTVGGHELVAVSKSPDAGLRSQVASCA